MLKKSKVSLLSVITGFFIGLINSLLGAGGGLLAVPFLKHAGLSQNKAHANAIAIILPITVISSISYLVKDYVNLKDAWIYIPTGLLGSLIGSFFLRKISPKALRIIFCGFMIYAGVRLLLR